MTKTEPAALLARRVIFADPERIIVRISPDGTRIAFLAPLEGVLNLWVAPLADVGAARPVTQVTDRNLGSWVVWMHDNRQSSSSASRAATRTGAPGGSILRPATSGR